MIGRRVPLTRSRAIACMTYNEYFNRRRMKIKRQARREERRYLKATMNIEEEP